MIWLPLAIILSAAVWMASIPTVCVPVAKDKHGDDIIACFEKVS